MQTTISYTGKNAIVRLQRISKEPAGTHKLEYTLNRLLEKGQTRIALDLTQLTSIGSEVVGLLIKTSQTLADQDGFLFLFGANKSIREYLETLGINQYIKIFENEAALERGMPR